MLGYVKKIFGNKQSTDLQPLWASQSFDRLGAYHDFWAYVVGYAPDEFKDVDLQLYPDQHHTLMGVFDDLRSGFHFAERQLRDDRLSAICRELIEMSQEAFLAGDRKRGCHTLQECEGLIWKGSRLRPKYVVEAERRAFGQNVLFADVVVSPYPYEGTEADLGPDQLRLFKIAELRTKLALIKREDFKYFSWVIDADGVLKRSSALPVDDDHPLLPPLQKSWGFKRLKGLAEAGDVRAIILVQVVGALGNGIITYDVEEVGQPRLAVKQMFERREDGLFYHPLRFHLEDPQFFPDPPIKADRC